MMKFKNNILIRIAILFSFIVPLQIVPCMAHSAPIISATYIQPSGAILQHSQPDLRTDFDLMSNLGISKVIIQWAAYGDYAYYPSKLSKPVNENFVDNIVKVAGQYQMDVYIGLPFLGDWFGTASAKKTEQYYNTLLTKTTAYSAELYALYGKNPIVKGWYVPYEFPVASLDKQLFINFLSKLSNNLKATLHGGVLMIAPYMGKSVWAPNEVAKWRSFLSKTDFDIIALQDGVGAHLNDPMTVANYMKGVSEVLTSTKVSLWPVIETFSNVNNKFSPTTADRLIKQLQLEGPYGSELVIFDFLTYMHPDRGAQARSLYDQMKSYLNRI